MAHTPGPWKADWTHREGVMPHEHKGWHVHNGHDAEPVICSIPDDERLDGCRVANAKLIAAAPDLLASLIALIISHGITDRTPQKLIDNAKSAIANATGK